MKQFYVYILASRTRVLYIGVTNDLMRRVPEHREKSPEGFTSRYNVNRLVYYEMTKDIVAALEREKQLKGWLRKRKVALINEVNPAWKDLSEGWFDEAPPSTRS
jgi:putative endonuclease